MATTNVIYEEREDRYSRAGSGDDDADLRRKKEMAAVLYNLIDRNYNLGNIDDKERTHVHGLIKKANDLGSFIGCHTEIVNIFCAKDGEGKLKDGDAVDDHCVQAYQGICELDARYKASSVLVEDITNLSTSEKVPPPPLNIPVHGVRRLRPDRPVPIKNSTPAANNAPKDVIPEAFMKIHQKYLKENGAVVCKECGDVTTTHISGICSNDRRKAARREESPIKKQITATNRAIAQHERRIAERVSHVLKARELDAELKEKLKQLELLQTFMPK